MAPPTRRQSSRESKDADTEPQRKKGKKEKASAKEQDQWMVLLCDEIVKVDSNPNGNEQNPSVCKLKHPRTKTASLFFFSADNSSVFQMFSFKDKYRSWFIGDTVHSDGSLYLTSPIDPLFLVLPYLVDSEENSSKFMTLDQLVSDAEFPECTRLLTSCLPHQLAHICDCKDIDEDLKVFRYNKDKCLSWLKKKTESLADAVQAQKLQVSSKGSHSSIFVRSKGAETTRESYVEYSFGMVSDFLSINLEKELKSFLGITDKKPEKKDSKENQDSQAENEPPSKKAKVTADITPTDDYSLGVNLQKNKKPTKLTIAQKKLSKVDKSGMKSISSFFSPKS